MVDKRISLLAYTSLLDHGVSYLQMMNLGWFLVNLLLVVVIKSRVSATGGVFHVQHKFAGQQPSLSSIKDHDLHRHQRLLYAVDLPLGGDGKATGTGLYYTKIKIGSPSKDYYVHVDTGSDLFWVNCNQCTQCPVTSSLIGVNLTLYNPSSSVNSELIKCDNDFCTSNGTRPLPGCVPASALSCGYRVAYGDGSSSSGYYVKDIIQYDRVSGNLETTQANSSVIFGCGVQQSGNLNSTDSALDGLLGFGQSETSVLSQIARTGSIKKVFAHCFDGDNGGGIFAMGNLVQPLVKTTPLVQNKTHYNVNLETIAVGNETLQLPIGSLGTVNGTDTIIDSGTTLAYFPDEIHSALVTKIMANHGDLRVQIVEGHYQCFAYNGSLDDGLPTVTLNFEDSLALMVPPRDYMFQIQANAYCIGWQSNGNNSSDPRVTILGDLVLSNKFVLYNLENQTIGWTDYNCSSTIGVQDEESNAIYQVGKPMARVSATGGVFHVQHKFAGQQPSLSSIKVHDLRRHQRLLYAVDLPLGGDGKATGTGLYYTKIKIGSPSKDYYVHVDTGSDLFWLNCIQCTQCPLTSSLVGVNLTLYNPSISVNSELIYCDNDFCTSNGNLETTPANSSVIFGCGVQQTGGLNNIDHALDGLLGFGQSEESVLSQIAGTGSIKKMFAHCFDGDNEGGIFAMGNVVQPLVNTTPLVQNKTHYNVNLETIAVGNETLQLPIGSLGTINGTDTIIDSGTTLAYFPDEILNALVTKGRFQCFVYNGSLDDGFPTVALNFEDSLALVVPPRDYMIQIEANAYCIGWQSSGNNLLGSGTTILGDLVLSNKFVLYNLVNQTIGWTDYNCSSTIGVQDEESNAIYQVGKLMAR